MIVIIHILLMISFPVNGMNKSGTFDNDLIMIFIIKI